MPKVDLQSGMIRVYDQLAESIRTLQKLYRDGYGKAVIEAIAQLDYKLRSGIPHSQWQEQLDRLEEKLGQVSDVIAAAPQPSPTVECATTEVVALGDWVEHSAKGLGVVLDLRGDRAFIDFGHLGVQEVQRSELRVTEGNRR